MEEYEKYHIQKEAKTIEFENESGSLTVSQKLVLKVAEEIETAQKFTASPLS